MGVVIVVTAIIVVIAVLFIRDQEKIQKRNANAPAYRGAIMEIPDDMQKIICPSWVVLDVETTGLHPETDRIIEFAARRYQNGVVESEYSTLIFPDQRIPKPITELTGIQDKELLKAPRFDEAMPKILDAISGLPMVAHNAKFDAEFLVQECARLGVTLDVYYIDTVQLARRAFPGLKNYKLNTLIHELGLLGHEQDHRAMSDVDATACLYAMCRDRLLSQPQQRRETSYHSTPQERDEVSRSYNERASTLNNLGRQYEAEGNIEKAIYYYGQAVAEGIEILHPYKRLAILHRKRKEYADEIRACTAAIQMLERQQPYSDNSIIEFQKRITYAKCKLGKDAGGNA